VKSHYVPDYPKQFSVKLTSIFQVWPEVNRAIIRMAAMDGPYSTKNNGGCDYDNSQLNGMLSLFSFGGGLGDETLYKIIEVYAKAKEIWL